MAHRNEPFVWHPVLYKGDTYAPGPFRWLRADRTPYDLTGATGTMQVRHRTSDTVLFEADLQFGERAEGEFSWAVAPEVTAVAPAGQHPYAVRLQLADGSRHTIMVGDLTIRVGVQ